MAYTKTTWVDRQVQYPLRFQQSVNGTQVTLTPDEGTITQAGTPITAANLNKIEQGIADNDTNKLDKTGGTVTGDLNVNTAIKFNGTVPFQVQVPGQLNWIFHKPTNRGSILFAPWSSALNDWDWAKGFEMHEDGNLDAAYINSRSDINASGHIWGNTVHAGSFKGLSDSNYIYFGDYGSYLRAAPTDAYLSFNSSNYFAVGTGGTNFIHNGRWIGQVKEGDTAGHMFIGGNGSGLQILSSGAGVQARNGSNTGYTNFYATSFTPSSLREMKKNIEPFVENATELIDSTPVYNYHFNEELDTELKHTGLIYDEVPWQMADVHGLGIDLYAMASILWKSNQELSAKLKEQDIKLQEQDAKLEQQASMIQQLEQRLVALESA